jgi:hypothetical protein
MARRQLLVGIESFNSQLMFYFGEHTETEQTHLPQDYQYKTLLLMLVLLAVV